MRPNTVKILLSICTAFSAFNAAYGLPSNANSSDPNAKHGAEEVHAKPELFASVKAVQAGKPFKLGVQLTMDPDWHTYYKDPGEAGMATSIDWQLPPGFKAGELLWEKPHGFNDAGITTYGYSGKTFIAAPITPPVNLAPGTKLTFSAKVHWLTCKEICLPGKGSVSLTLPVASGSDKVEPDHVADFERANFNGDTKGIKVETHDSSAVAVSSESGGGNPPTGTDGSDGRNQTSGTGTDGSGSAASGGKFDLLTSKLDFDTDEGAPSLLAALGLAFVGGFILNFMPCVLPVIAIKILSFLQQARDEPKRVKMLGLTFSAGITATFLLLASIVLLVQEAGQSVGWGFQFQYPGFIVAMCVVVLLFALSLFGLFYVGVSASDNELTRLADKEGFVGTFFKGVLATVLSTPCTAPFLGTALGFAFTQSAGSVLLIFFTIGLGMSLPYLVLTAKPDWMKFVPKPGDWMEKLKESFGFVLLATVVWLLYVLGSQVGAESVAWTCAFLVAIAFAAWLISRFTNLSSSQEQKFKVWSIASVVVLTSFYFFVATKPGIGFVGEAAKVSADRKQAATTNESGAITWQPLDINKLNAELNSNKTVFLDFTAQWCLTCKVNEQTILSTAPIVEKLKALNVVTMKADWTSQDETITALLHKFRRSGVPLYVVLPAGKPNHPIVLPEVITTDLVLQALDKAGPSKG